MKRFLRLLLLKLPCKMRSFFLFSVSIRNMFLRVIGDQPGPAFPVRAGNDSFSALLTDHLLRQLPCGSSFSHCDVLHFIHSFQLCWVEK